MTSVRSRSLCSNGPSQYFLFLFLKCLLVSRLILFRLSPFIPFGTCNHYNLAVSFHLILFSILRRATAYTSSIRNNLDSLWLTSNLSKTHVTVRFCIPNCPKRIPPCHTNMVGSTSLTDFKKAYDSVRKKCCRTVSDIGMKPVRQINKTCNKVRLNNFWSVSYSKLSESRRCFITIIFQLCFRICN
jgi:hypothetical protein